MSEKVEKIVDLGFEVGETFNTFYEFKSQLEKVTKQKCVQMSIFQSRTVESARKKVKRHLDDNLLFYSVQWACIYGGRSFKSRGLGLRKTTSFRKKDLCPAHIQIRISDAGNDFVVVSVDNRHNHIISEKLYKELPHCRQLPEDIRADTKILLRRGVKKSIVQANLRNELGYHVTLKDLNNLKQEKDKRRYDVEKLSRRIQNKFGTDCHLLLDKDDSLRGLVLCTEEMVNSLTAYPEVICLDTTYKLLNAEAPLYMILNEDGNGESAVIAIGILIEEDSDSLTWFFEKFKSVNPSWREIKHIVSDKNMIARDFLITSFPDAEVQISPFHILRIFQHEIKSKKYEMSATIRKSILEMCQKLVFSKSDNEFDSYISQLEEKWPEIYNYLRHNWLNMRNEWCPYLGNRVLNFLNTTNNRVTRIDAKFKEVLQNDSSLEDFIDHLFIALESVEKEKLSRIASDCINKRKTLTYPDDYKSKYYKHLTPYAFEQLETHFTFNHLKFTDNVANANYIFNTKYLDIITTPNTCSCHFFKSMGLPCRHIFAIRTNNCQELFSLDLIIDRWKMSYYLKHSLFLRELITEQESNPRVVAEKQSVKMSTGKTTDTLTAQDKRHTLLAKAKVIAALASDLNEDGFLNVCGALDSIISGLRDTKDEIKVEESSNGDLVEYEHIEDDLESSIDDQEEQDVDISSKAAIGTSSEDSNHSLAGAVRDTDLKNVVIIKKRAHESGDDTTDLSPTKIKRKPCDLKPFEKLLLNDRVGVVLEWILKEPKVVNVRQLEMSDLVDVDEADVRILEVDLAILKEYFAEGEWGAFEDYKKRVEEIASWNCLACDENVAEEPSVRCDYCLHWYHFECESLGPITETGFKCSKCTSNS